MQMSRTWGSRLGRHAADGKGERWGRGGGGECRTREGNVQRVDEGKSRKRKGHRPSAGTRSGSTSWRAAGWDTPSRGAPRRRRYPRRPDACAPAALGGWLAAARGPPMLREGKRRQRKGGEGEGGKGGEGAWAGGARMLSERPRAWRVMQVERIAIVASLRFVTRVDSISEQALLGGRSKGSSGGPDRRAVAGSASRRRARPTAGRTSS